MTSPALPLSRDIRSAAHSAKRDRDASEKWSLGVRPSAGVKMVHATGEYAGGSEGQREKVRPEVGHAKSGTHKNAANITPKPTLGRGYLSHNNACLAFRGVAARMEAAADHNAMLDGSVSANKSSYCPRAPLRRHDSPLSRSLLELLPTHSNNTLGSVSLLSDADDSPGSHVVSPDVGVFYSFERKEAPGGPVDLGDLVDRAERRWEGQRTEKLVRGEWEVLNEQGESMRLKGRGKQRGAGGKQEKSGSSTAMMDLEKEGSAVVVEDEFELV